MASLELDIMKSFTIACEVIKSTVTEHVRANAADGQITLTNKDFAKLTQIINSAVDQAARNSHKQMQSAVKLHVK